MPQVGGRPTSILLGWRTSLHPFVDNPTYREIADRPWEELLTQWRKPEVKQRMITEEVEFSHPLHS